MPRPSLVVLLASLALVLAVRPPASAQSEALTKTEIACQDAMAKDMGTYGKARTACVAKCAGKTPLSPDCTSPFANATLDCVDKAQTKLADSLAKKCQSDGTDADSCPECYEQLNGYGTCSAFEDAVKAKVIALADDITSTIFCDDSGSPDGLTKAEAKCQKTLVSGFTAFVSSATACGTSCVKRERKGKTDGTCDPATLGGGGGDSKAVACLFKAFLKLGTAEAKCAAPKGDTPECLTDVGGLFTRVENGLVDIGTAIDVCPAQ